MKQMLIYDRVVPVTREKHGGHSFKPLTDCNFARQTNSVPLVTQEFSLAALHYAIVFARVTDGIIPAAVLGVRDSENLFVTADGIWDTGYVPAFIRRYPFVFGADEKAQTLTLLIDESCSAFNTSGQGERMFDARGEQTDFLKNILNFLSEYQAQSETTAAFTRIVDGLGLLEPSEAHLPIPSNPECRLSGFLMVNREKLRALPADKLAELNASGALELIYLHMISLMNLGKLQERMAAASPVAA